MLNSKGLRQRSSSSTISVKWLSASSEIKRQYHIKYSACTKITQNLVNAGEVLLTFLHAYTGTCKEAVKTSVINILQVMELFM